MTDLSNAILGIDVAEPNGHVVWPSVVQWRGAKGERVEFAICRCTVGNLGLDTYFLPNWTGIDAVGLIRGGYHAADPDEINIDDAKAEATRFCKRLLDSGFRKGADFAMLDIERAAKIHAGATFATWARDFCRVCVAQLGCKPVIYTGKYFWTDETRGCADQSILDELATYPLVLAAYVGADVVQDYVPAIWKDWVIWQRSGDQAAHDCEILHVGGITGNVDRDVFRGSPDDLRAFIASLATVPTTIPAPPDLPIAVPDGSSVTGLQRDRQAEIADEALSTTLPETPTSKSSQRMPAVNAPIIDDGPKTPRGSNE